jgi:hypothetical protein
MPPNLQSVKETSHAYTYVPVSLGASFALRAADRLRCFDHYHTHRRTTDNSANYRSDR